jgi:hypothetical protein
LLKGLVSKEGLTDRHAYQAIEGVEFLTQDLRLSRYDFEKTIEYLTRNSSIVAGVLVCTDAISEAILSLVQRIKFSQGRHTC